MPHQNPDYATGHASDYAAGQLPEHERVPVPQAAERLGITENALRKRVQRNTVDWMRNSDGRVFVYLPPTMTGQASGHADDQVGSQPEADHADLAESLQDQVDYLRGVLETRDRELSEMRRIVAGLVQRVPELEPARDASPEATGGHVSHSHNGSNGVTYPRSKSGAPGGADYSRVKERVHHALPNSAFLVHAGGIVGCLGTCRLAARALDDQGAKITRSLEAHPPSEGSRPSLQPPRCLT